MLLCHWLRAVRNLFVVCHTLLPVPKGLAIDLVGRVGFVSKITYTAGCSTWFLLSLLSHTRI